MAMETSVVNVTPEMAREWLEKNTLPYHRPPIDQHRGLMKGKGSP